MATRILAPVALSVALVGTSTASAATVDTARHYDPATDELLRTFPSPAANELAFQKRYHSVAYDNSDKSCPNCSAALTSESDSTGSFARLRFSLQPGHGPTWTVENAHVGFLVPLDNLWRPDNDVRGLSEIRFKARLTASNRAIATLSLESPLAKFYSIGISPETELYGFSSEWRWISIPMDEFGYPSWNDLKAGREVALTIPDSLGNIRTVQDVYDRNPLHFPYPVPPCDTTAKWCLEERDSPSNILQALRTLKFRISTLLPLNSQALTGTFDVDSIVLAGIKRKERASKGNACSGPSRYLLDPAARSATGRNPMGGAWHALAEPRNTTDSTGASKFQFEELADGSYLFAANLARRSPALHPFGGFASLGSWLGPDGSNASVDLPGLKAVSFRISRLALGIDTNETRGVEFALHSRTIGRDRAFSILVPWSQIRDTSATDVCVDLDALRQPDWWTGEVGATLAVPTGLGAISWSLRLGGFSDTAADAGFRIHEVRLWGVEDPASALPAPHRNPSLVATGRTLRILDLDPSEPAILAVRGLDGALRFRSALPAGSSARTVETCLARGTYAVTIERRSLPPFTARILLAP